MKSEPAASADVVELMATWSAAADPVTADLFATLTPVAPVEPDGLDEIRAVLEQRPELLDAETKTEIRRLCDATGSVADRSAIRRIHRRLSTQLSERIAEQHGVLQRQVGEWGAAMDAEQAGRCLDLLWQAERSEGLGAMELLDRLEKFLEQTRAEALADLKEGGATQASGSPREIAAALAAMRRAGQAQGRQQQAGINNDASERLARLCDEVEQRLDGAAPAADRLLTSLARSTIESSRRAVSVQSTPSASMLARHATLETLTEALDRCNISDASLRDQLTAVAGARPTSSGEPPREASGESAGKIDGLVARLESSLTDSAAAIPAAESVKARLLIQRALELRSSSEVAAMDGVAEELGQRQERLKELVSRAQRAKHDHGEQRRRELLERVEKLMPLTDGGVRNRLTKLAAGLEGAGSEDIESLERTVDEIAQPAENDLRLRAARRVSGKREDCAELAAALDEDDLPAMAEQLRRIGEAASGGFFTTPIGRISIAAIALAVVVVGFTAWRSAGGAAKDYTVLLSGSPTGKSVTLIKDGSIHDRQTHDGAAGASFSLADGEYEIYVDDRFTGRLIRAPQDPARVDDVPVPAL